MSIAAKFKVESVKDTEYGQTVEFDAAHGPGNEAWSKATPSGKLTIYISNPEARGHFRPGEYVSLTIAPFPKEG